MSADGPKPGTFSLRRWSERKLATARSATERVATTGAASAPESPPPAPAAAAVPAAAPAVPAEDPVALPPVESLTFESDFTAFLQPKVDEGLKRQALKQLFRDPRFNLMDGLDVYIDDYSLPDPISPEVVRGLMQARYIFDPPATRVNERGSVEDVPVTDATSLPEPSPAAAVSGEAAAASVPERADASTGPDGSGAAAVPDASGAAVTPPPARPEPAPR